MREIKFRQFYHGKMMFFGFMDEGHKHNSFISPAHCCNKKYPAMQFTGLQDSEGVDIYEGDVWLRDDFIALVEFKYSQWTLTKAESSICFQHPYFYSNAKTGSVIGNIHQNPELLELKK